MIFVEKGGIMGEIKYIEDKEFRYNKRLKIVYMLLIAHKPGIEKRIINIFIFLKMNNY